MSLDIDALSVKMERLFNEIIIRGKLLSLENLKNELFNKKEILSMYRSDFNGIEQGKISKNFLDALELIEVDFKNLYDNFDDKLMIFIIGNGNVGKSTLLNALIGYEVAETNFLPNTWKIDVFSTELDKGKAIVKYSDGKIKELPIDQAKQLIGEEEIKSKESKKIYNEKLKEALGNIKTKEEREEMKRYLSEKYLYKSKISEVRWPVEKNWILEKCLLVDTPGLNQNLYDLNELGNIHDYYHKADGVLWILDGQTISASKVGSLYQELEEAFKTVGGVRENIIGVVNRMDLVKKNGGVKAVDEVIKESEKIFGNRFSKIVHISAYQAFQGFKNKNESDINESGILTLQSAIRDIFIKKSESVKRNAKVQGYNKLVNLVNKEIENYYSKIEEYEKMYSEKKKKLELAKEKLIEKIKKEIHDFFELYLMGVKQRVDTYIYVLSEGKGSNFVKENIYNINELIKNREILIDNLLKEINNNKLSWERMCKISEYKYIQSTNINSQVKALSILKMDFSELNNIKYHIPLQGDDLFTLLSNAFGKFMFFIRKDGIKREIINLIEKECYNMKAEMTEQIYNIILENYKYCETILNTTFKEILFDYKFINKIKEELKNLQIMINEENDNVRLIDILK